MFSPVRRLLSYLAGKRSELEDLGYRDIVMAKAVLDIHRKRTHKERTTVPLSALHPIHTLDRENAIQATARRVETLRAHQEALHAAGTLTFELLAEHLPSVSWIKVVEENPSVYLAFEGNGRLAALQEVFTPADEMLIEVELYRFKRPQTIVRRLNRVRELNGLLPVS